MVPSYEYGERRLEVLEIRQIVAGIELDFVDFMGRLDALLRSGAGGVEVFAANTHLTGASTELGPDHLALEPRGGGVSPQNRKTG